MKGLIFLKSRYYKGLILISPKSVGTLFMIFKDNMDISLVVALIFLPSTEAISFCFPVGKDMSYIVGKNLIFRHTNC